MSTSIEHALATLRLPAESSPTEKEVLEAFVRLSRRYPPASFPERFRGLIEARDTLLDPARDLRGLFTNRRIDVAWLPPLIARHGGETTQASDPRRELLLSMLRTFYTTSSDDEDFDDDDEIDLDDLDPAMIEELIRRLGIPGKLP